MLVVSPSVKIPLDEFEFTYARSSGPGGQNVNKVNSKALLRWPILVSPNLPAAVRERFVAKYGSRLTNEGDLLISSQQSRDQGQNTQDCLDKLREMLVSVLQPPKRRRPTKPTRSSQKARGEAKKQNAQKKEHRRKPKMDD